MSENLLNIFYKFLKFMWSKSFHENIRTIQVYGKHIIFIDFHCYKD